MTAQQTQLSLTYHGRAVDEGRLNVYDAAANMIAFSEFVTVAGKAVYGPDVHVKAEVAGFRSGSFVTDLYFEVLLPTLPILASVNMPEVLKTIKYSIDIWKHLKGSPPKQVESSHNGDSISITNHDGKVIVVNRPSFTVVMSDKGAATVEKFIGGPLNMDGIDWMEILSGKKELAKVKDSEASYFTSVAAVVPLTTNEFDFALTIEAPVFKEGNKWRFSDGSSTFYADIEDEDFLKRVDDGESFAKGDALRVRLRVDQSRQGPDLTTTKTVLKVIEHIRRHQPGQLF